MMRYLKSGSFLIFFFISCSGPYKHLQVSSSIPESAFRFKPEFSKVLYRCVVNGRVVLKKFHLSGLLLFKTMDDGTTRAVFQNEMGFTFFDFEWGVNDSFSVNQIIPQLNKSALVKTLKKDMDLLLMKNLDRSSEKLLTDGTLSYHRFDLENGHAYYIVDATQLKRVENAGKSKVTSITFSGRTEKQSMPESVVFEHHKANFTIQLDKIEVNAAD